MAVSLLLVLGPGSLTMAADWPQWRGPNRDGAVPAGERLPTNLPPELKLRWQIPAGPGYSSPVVAGGPAGRRVFYSDLQDDREVLHAVDAATGEGVWHTPVDAAFKDDWGVGPRCTPVVDGDRVFAQSCRGELQCLRTGTGARMWSRNYVRDFGAVFMGETGPAAGATRHGNTGSPLVDGEHLIVQAGGRPGASLVCLQKITGEVVWKSQDDTAGNAAPILAMLGGVRQVISFTAEALVSVQATDGTLLWRVPLATRLGRHIMTPVVIGDRVFAGSYQLGLVAIEVRRDGEVFHAERVWTRKELAPNFACPIAIGSRLFGVAPEPSVYAADPTTGDTVWSQTGLLRASGERAFASFLALGENVLMLSDRGELVLFEARPARFEAIARTQACGVTWCSPAHADGHLYVRDAKTLFCFDLLP